MQTVPQGRAPRNTPDPSSFIPNSFFTPNIIIDQLLPLLMPTEYVVLSWMIRHILGWQDNIENRGANLSLSTFINGYRGYNGCGLQKQAVIRALAGLEQHGVIAAEDGGQRGKFYRLTYTKVDWDSLYDRQAEWDEIEKRRTAPMHQARRSNSDDESGTYNVLPEPESGGMCDILPPSREGGMSDIPIKIQEEKYITFVAQAPEPERSDPSPFQRLNSKTGETYEEEENATPLIPDLVYEDLETPKKPRKRAAKQDKKKNASQKEVKESSESTEIVGIISAYLKGTGAVQPTAYANKTNRALAKALLEAGITREDVSTYIAEEIVPSPFWREKTPSLQFVANGISRWKEARQTIEKSSEDIECDPLSEAETVEFDNLLNY